ncbi:HAD family hydrolase [Planotetraspora mira]|uniref:HAD family hydrolase n=1 Tax=Planotetraspora mira TaxID=58121 RepID=UPI003570FD7B
MDLISARVDPNPGLMKPNPHLVQQATLGLGADPSLTLLVGDSATDMLASKAAGVTAVGYANKPGKADRLSAAGADVLVTSINELLVAL